MQISRVGLASLLVILSTQPGPRAFSSLEVYGGAYHQRITHQALAPLKISSETLELLDLGNLETDKFYGELFSFKPLHFTDQTFDESEDVLEDRLETVVELAAEAVKDYHRYREAMFEFGIYLHAVQDFYAHTNWVEAHLARGIAEIPLAPDDFEDFPVPVNSPYTLARTFPPGEVTEAEAFEDAFRRPFHRASDLDTMDDRKRIQTAAAYKKAFTHHDLAKDNPSYRAGQVRWSPDAPTVFEIALELARRETRRQWDLLEEEIADEYEEECPPILRVLRNGWMADFPAGSAQASVGLSQGKLRLRRDLMLEVDLTLTPSEWSQEGAQRALELASSLSRPEGEKDRYTNEGVSELRFLRQDEQRQFRLTFRANLYGSARSFAILRPIDDDPVKGRWEMRLRLPKGLSQIHHLELSAPSPAIVVEESGQRPLRLDTDLGPFLGPDRSLRLILPAPRAGWQPPSWLREYLRVNAG